MTERERRFVECYMGEAAGNGTKAAVLAGYSPATARNQASRLLTKDDIRSAIEERGQRDELTWTREQRQAFWTRVAADESLEIRDRLRATELLARSQGDFIEKRLLQIEGNGRSTLAELIAGSGPPSLQPAQVAAVAPAIPATSGPVTQSPTSAVTAPTPSALEEAPVVSPDHGRQRLWVAERTPVVEGPVTSNTDWNPSS